MHENSIQTLLWLKSIGLKITEAEEKRLAEWEANQVPLEELEKKATTKTKTEINKAPTKPKTVKNIVN